MRVLGIQGSPRKKGNTDLLLSAFLGACEKHGARTRVIRPHETHIQPCRELIVCEKKGFCPIKDEMAELGYQAIGRADLVVLASPVFFYGISAQAKVFIDRCQMFWARKYKLKLKDPNRFTRQGFLLSVAASGGKRLFDGVHLTAKYFFDAVSAQDSGALTYKKIERPGQIMTQPGLEEDIEAAVTRLFFHQASLPKLVFVSQNSPGTSIMAAAFAKELSKGALWVRAWNIHGQGFADSKTVQAMADLGLDIHYFYGGQAGPDALTRANLSGRDHLVFLGSCDAFQSLGPSDCHTHCWELAWDMDCVKGGEALRDDIKTRVEALVTRICGAINEPGAS